MAHNDDEHVHDEWDHVLVPSTHGGNIHYRVFYGTVSWTKRPEDLQRALVVFMQHGTTADWQKAKSNGEIQFRKTSHYLDIDYEAVRDAMNYIYNKHVKKQV